MNLQKIASRIVGRRIANGTKTWVYYDFDAVHAAFGKFSNLMESATMEFVDHMAKKNVWISFDDKDVDGFWVEGDVNLLMSEVMGAVEDDWDMDPNGETAPIGQEELPPLEGQWSPDVSTSMDHFLVAIQPSIEVKAGPAA
jgi:hypothetical protein